MVPTTEWNVTNVAEAEFYANQALYKMEQEGKSIMDFIRRASFSAKACGDRVGLLHNVIHKAVEAGESSETLYALAALAGYAPESGIECDVCRDFVRAYKAKE